VVALRDALEAPETTGLDSDRIAVGLDQGERLVLENLSLALAGGRAAFDQPRVEVAPGERVLIVVEHGSDKSALFRALAGLAPWGAGTIRLPPREAMMLLPPRPYLPLGTLRAGASYPAVPGRFDDAAVAAALERVGLCHLLPSLDREGRWDKELSLEEQQRLAFARLLLHRPRWVLLNDALGALDDEQRQLMLAMFEHELAEAAVVCIGRSPGRTRFYDRTVHFRRLDQSATLVPLRLRPRPARPRPTDALVQPIRASG
jgi:putative ATP-binding cassette transporter